MSLYEMHYVTSTSEQARLKEQQQTMRKALEELSISTKLQQEQEENDRFMTKGRWYPYLQVSAECRPYTPYLPEPDCESMMDSTCSINSSSAGTSILTRKLSMSSVSSSFVSDSDKTIEIEERDQYGFKRPTEWVEPKQLQAFDIKYKSILQKQTKSWNKLFNNNDQQWPALCSQLSRYVRYGVPQETRTNAWLHYSGANNKMKQNPGLYSTLETSISVSPERDRIFLDHPLFTGESNQIPVLRRILNAFHLYCPEIEYCQSIHFLAGFLLILLEQEEHVFWLLVTTVQDLLPKGLFSKTGSDLEQTVFMMMVYEKMPGVWAKVANKKCFWECEQTDSLPSITLVTTHWFSTLFINVLPIETVLRIWDCFYIGEGYTVLYKAALTIIKLNEQAIWNALDSVDTIKILQNMPKRLVDCHEFIKSIFSPHGIAFDLTTEEVNRKRGLFLNRKSLRK